MFKEAADLQYRVLLLGKWVRGGGKGMMPASGEELFDKAG
jgi:hypothetical protein|tara:strand:- start:133 stop:252 length:120 start_codon:yes stop_codon:yes gene_type:complete